MNNNIIGNVLITSLIILNSCDLMMDFIMGPPHVIELNPAIYNLEGINTPYDEYNPAAIPEPFTLDLKFVFSTNNSSSGKNFDIVKGRINFSQQPFIKGNSAAEPEINSNKFGVFLDKETNSPQNEYGPIFFGVKNSPVNSKDSNIKTSLEDSDFTQLVNTYLFSSDRNNKSQDIYFYSQETGLKNFFGNVEGFDDAYPTYDYKRNVLYFSSSREGNFDIYKYENKSGNQDFKSWLGDETLTKNITKADEFNSIKNDTAPYIKDDFMVFASDRNGGKGGYDIYYSKFTGGNWSKPQNLQEVFDKYNLTYPDKKIILNTASDEFRPSLYMSTFKSVPQPVMLFSSNRSGGKGGFDLYLAIMPNF